MLLTFYLTLRLNRTFLEPGVDMPLVLVYVVLVHGPEAKFSEIGTTQRDKGSYVFFC